MKQITQYTGYILFVVVGVVALSLLGESNEWRQTVTTAAATTDAISTRYAETDTNAQAVQGTATAASVSARATITAGNAAAATLEAQLQEIQSLANSQLDHQTTLETDIAQQQQISQAYELALASQQLLDSSKPNSELAALLAVEAMQLYQNPYTFNALSQSLSFLPRFMIQMTASDRRTDRFLFTQDGSRLLTWGLDFGQQTPPTLWDTDTGERLATMSDAGVLEISKEGRYLALYNWPDDPYIIDTAESQPAMSLPHPVYGIYGLGVGFNSDSTQVAYSMEIVVDLDATTSSEKYDSIFVIQDIASGEIVLDVVISDSYNKISFSSDNRYVVGVNYPNVEIWELDTMQMITQFSSTVSWPDAVLFSPDNHYLVIAGVEGLILWDLEQDREIPVEFLVGVVESVRFSLDSRYLVVTRQEQWDAGEGGAWYTGQNGTQVWDVMTGTEVLYLPHANNDAGFIGETHQLLTLDQAGTVEIWDVVTRELVVQAQINDQIATGLNPNGTRIASIDDQGQIHLWAIEPYVITQILYPMTVYDADYREPDNLDSLTYSPDGSTLATSSWDGQVRFWDTTSGLELEAFLSRSRFQSLVFSQDGTHMAIVGGNSPSPAPGWIPSGLTRIWDQSAGITISLTHELELNDVEFSPNGQIFATASTLTQIWDTNTGTELLACAPEVDPLDLAFTPNGNDLIVLTEDRAVICDVRTGEIRPLFSATVGSRYRVMTLHPNGRLLAVAETSHILLWDITTNMQVYDLVIPDDNPQLKLIFSEGGEYLGLFSPRNSLTIWDTSTWQEVLQVRDNLLNDFAFSPDSYYVVLGLGYFGGEARVLTLPDGIEVNRLVYDANIAQVAFHPNGQQVALLGQYESVVLWNWNPGEWVQEVCGRVSRNLTYEEWRAYFGFEPYHQTCLNLPLPSTP